RQLLLRDWEGKPTAQLTIDFDVSDRKKFEIRAQRDRRLESIGTLAGGVAHDLNNVLSPILMASKMLKREGADYHKLADTIVMSAERCSKMIRKLLSFAGGTIDEYERITLGEIARETHLILLHAIPSSIELTVDSSDDLYPVFGDPTEISQILMNLAINARDAMPDGGTLDIRFENVVVDEFRFERRHLLEFGDYVRISVADTGCGILPEDVDKVFDPFFTTKSQDKGTGLGLATTMGIVRSHHGEVFLQTEPGMGSTFYVYLPSDTGNSQIGSDEPIQRIGDMRSNGQTIMLVDDESLILETAQSALKLHGYKVITAGGGAEAVATFQDQGSQIDVVILDMMMPGMDGLQTHYALRSMDPDVKVIATSGLRRLGKTGSRLTDVNGFLEKPYSDQQLFEIVATTLAEKTVGVES
ncbi:MAG: two-component system cell cycle sensor histidine kinase/response regulator CckA, partial [Mariniblastus sp.]